MTWQVYGDTLRADGKSDSMRRGTVISSRYTPSMPPHWPCSATVSAPELPEEPPVLVDEAVGAEVVGVCGSWHQRRRARYNGEALRTLGGAG
jgi:hypothetical protein